MLTPARQKIFDIVLAAATEITPSEISARLGVSQATACIHLKYLLGKGLVSRRYQGKYAFYAPAERPGEAVDRG